MGKKLWVAGVLAVSLWACHQAILSAPLESTMTMVVNPDFIDANGGRATVSVLVVEDNTGTGVPDGTVVQFFTNLGRIDEQGKTNDGVARVNLVGDGRSGTARVQAFSGAASAEPVDVLVGNLNATAVQVTADPQRIRPNDPRVSTIRAVALDANGNALASVPVRFSFSASPNEETLEPGPGPFFTDSNGQATVTLRTRRDREALPKEVTVTATLPLGATENVVVTVN